MIKALLLVSWFLEPSAHQYLYVTRTGMVCNSDGVIVSLEGLNETQKKLARDSAYMQCELVRKCLTEVSITKSRSLHVVCVDPIHDNRRKYD